MKSTMALAGACLAAAIGAACLSACTRGEDDYLESLQRMESPGARGRGTSGEVSEARIEEIKAGLLELPAAKLIRFQESYDLNDYDANVLVADQDIANYFEQAVNAAKHVPAKTVGNWITGEIFGWMNQSGETIQNIQVTPEALGELLSNIQNGEINQTTGKAVLVEMLQSGSSARHIIESKGLRQVSDSDQIARMVQNVLDENPQQVAEYLGGKEGLINWLFGQVMRSAKGKANPQVVREELSKQLAILGSENSPP